MFNIECVLRYILHMLCYVTISHSIGQLTSILPALILWYVRESPYSGYEYVTPTPSKTYLGGVLMESDSEDCSRSDESITIAAVSVKQQLSLKSVVRAAARLVGHDMLVM
jgi:hypothetical protein